MKFFFAKTDSLYKIFKTLERIPSQKEVEIFIDPEHALFENEWRGSQIKDIIDKRSLKAIFVTKKEKNRKYFENLGLVCNYIEEKQAKKILNMLGLFFFNIKKFHLHAYNSQKYMFVVVFFFEALFVLLILWFLVSLILPSATLTIKPAEQIETLIYNFRYYPNTNVSYPTTATSLTIPFYTGSIDYKYDLVVSTENIKHIASPSKGQIKVYNTTPESYSLVGNTRFITSDGLLFKTLSTLEIATGSVENPSETLVYVEAMEKDNLGTIQGVRGNIKAGTELLIKNMNSSYYLHEIWAEALQDFQGGTLQSLGSITEKDIQTLSEKLTDMVYKQKMNTVSKNFSLADAVLLPFDSLTTTQFRDTVVEGQPGDSTSTLKGSSLVTYTFRYVKWEDIMKALNAYIQERPSEKIQVLTIDKNSLNFLKDTTSMEVGEIRKDGEVLIIPTKIDVVQGYDFEKDINNLLPDVKNTISGKSVDEARKYILSFPEVASVKVSVSPPWYSDIPTIKSRIKVVTEK